MNKKTEGLRNQITQHHMQYNNVVVITNNEIKNLYFLFSLRLKQSKAKQSEIGRRHVASMPIRYSNNKMRDLTNTYVY